jgi:hypothetical protein
MMLRLPQSCGGDTDRDTPGAIPLTKSRKPFPRRALGRNSPVLTAARSGAFAYRARRRPDWSAAAITQSNAGHDRREDTGPAEATRRTKPAFIEPAKSAQSEARFNIIRSMHGGPGREVLDTARRNDCGMNAFRQSSQCAKPGHSRDTLQRLNGYRIEMTTCYQEGPSLFEHAEGSANSEVLHRLAWSLRQWSSTPHSSSSRLAVVPKWR